MSDNVEATKSNVGFMEHMTKMDDESKSLLMNMTQYAILVSIPILALNYISEIVFPEHEESKGNFELVVEIVGSCFYTYFFFLSIDYDICSNIWQNSYDICEFYDNCCFICS